MKKLEVFDPALCCSTGVCGTEVDQALVDFATDMDWLKKQGASIRRFNLAQEPMEFVNNTKAKTFLETAGAGSLPLLILDGEIVLTGRYPKRHELARWFGIRPNIEKAEIVKSCCGNGKTCC
ncbi:arsenite efflux transporter metallochaperone ArsD [Morganella morganii]|uniref:arsenite efflux transporter metallochaperone ArsD n=1 Tax=Morganella morganii TaxID=582 RepID=UPI000561484B|nr:arsenite efflux transporter metallochaperone ArsD [Morganella morganii]EJG2204476.1 arsenite efflux transporter metallochaperone ArsD [Morganella morganii]ELN8405046.1 arsenite efflux transporter metallochaperone ArsD [Morganella morganii]MBT0399634.1 arsenite efflux transporter metallochaperone ArsD [Morganella morganii subsp. morganii]MBX9343026.1 arsenite efflux transporter metallochaperone ArsD [Morganella morganii]MBX9369400.1 arsenite efflux transporter metallochaperone ArsD [Morganel